MRDYKNKTVNKGRGKMNVKQEILEQAAKAAPPVAIVAASATSDWTIGDTVGLITILYLALQSAYLIYKWLELRRIKREDSEKFARILRGED